MQYTIKQAAAFAGVSERTLRHYDATGLLRPARSPAGYRLYTHGDLERLQEILLYRSLDLSLEEIGGLLQKQDRHTTLRDQIEKLEAKAAHYGELAELAQRTMALLEGGEKMTEKDLFRGLSYEEMREHEKAYDEETRERWGESDAYRTSKQRSARRTKHEWDDINREQSENERTLTSLYQEGASFDSKAVQAVTAAQHEFINRNFYVCPLEMFSSLGLMYVEDERFKAHYEKYADGLADFYNRAIQHYCQEKK